VDLEQGRIIADEELKKKYSKPRTRIKWLEENHVLLKNLPEPPHVSPKPITGNVLQRQQAFGYTFEDLRFIVGPMARDGMQPLGSMGTDTPLAVLSNKPQLLYNYFKQLFAQVTNPPIDPIREEIITSTKSWSAAKATCSNRRRKAARSGENALSDPHERGIGKIAAHQPPRFQIRHAADFVQGRRRRKVGKRRWKNFSRRRPAIDGRREHFDSFRPRRERDAGAHSRAAGGGGFAPSFDPQRHAHASRL
jgi:hypothetical protein